MMQNSTSANNGRKSHKELPLALASWPQGIGKWARLEFSAQKAPRASRGHAVGSEARPLPPLGLLLPPPPTLMGRE